MDGKSVRIGLATVALSLGIALPSAATPPDYSTFGRAQRADVTIAPGDLLRIWVAYVGQGDGILIQLPTRMSRNVGTETPERLDVLIDGGSANEKDAARMQSFIEELYPAEAIDIEHAVITHHDMDHVLGLTRILESHRIGVGHVYHNGLASFVPGARGFPATGKSAQPGVSVSKDGTIRRTLGLLDDNRAFLPAFVMDDLVELRQSNARHELEGIYADLAAALVGKASPHAVTGVHRVSAINDFIGEVQAKEAPPGLPDVRFEVVWPRDTPRKFGKNWGETINGNSVTFRLRYGDFEMLFTGDQNEASEEAMLADLEQRGALDTLQCDVLKVPHHGSSHGIEPFFRAVNPVVSVATMGPEGARSKKLSDGAWEHPSPQVIEWLGGAHRVYLTELHERKFDWADITTAAKLDALRERTHVLIETDGNWFRVVEVPIEGANLEKPPTVAQTARGNGTRWIRAR